MRKLLFFLFVIALLPLALHCDNGVIVDICAPQHYGEPAATQAPLHAIDGHFRDARGGLVILRGVNVSGDSKVPPFTPISNGAMLDPLPVWGFNAIRLLFTWEAFEPTRCAYNDGYMEYYERVVRWAAERGLYVIVDFHQDAFSRYSIDGCGEGFPQWAVTKEVALKTPDNGPACSSWGVKMIFDLSHHKTWEDFHSDKYGARTRYLNMVEAVADRMSKHPNVIGYDLINEPWGTDAELHSLYEKVAEKIRGRHPDTILFVPPHAIVSGGMADNNIAQPGFGNFAYSPHYYDGTVILFQSWLGTDPAGSLDKMRATANAWRAPMILSEFGAPAMTKNVGGYMERLYAWLDKHWASGTQWCYTPGWNDITKDGWNTEDLSVVDDRGRLRANLVLRPYPQRVAGTPDTFLRDDSGFTVSWVNDSSAGSTVVYLPEGYATGRRLRVDLPDGADGGCELTALSLVCTVQGQGKVQVIFAK